MNLVESHTEDDETGCDIKIQRRKEVSEEMVALTSSSLGNRSTRGIRGLEWWQPVRTAARRVSQTRGLYQRLSKTLS